MIKEKTIKELTTKELQDEYCSLHYSIEVNDVYNKWDLVRYELIAQELEERGYEIQQGAPSFVKEEEEE